MAGVFNPYTQQMEDVSANAFQAPLSANTMQLQAAPTGGLYDPLNQAVLGYYQQQREQAAAEQEQIAAAQNQMLNSSAIKARQDELAYQHGRDDKADLLASKKQKVAEKIAAFKAEKEAAKNSITAKIIRATGQKKGLDLSMYADDELVQAKKNGSLADYYAANAPAKVKPVREVGIASEGEAGLVHNMIRSQLGLQDDDVNTNELEATVADKAGLLQAAHAQQGKQISYMDAVKAVMARLQPHVVTTGADDYIPFNENRSVQFEGQ